MRKTGFRCLGLFLILFTTMSASLYGAEEMVFSTFQEDYVDREICFQILTEAYNRLGQTIRIDRLPAERALISSNDGIYDGELYRIGGMNKFYSNLIQIPVVILYADFVIVTQDDSVVIKDWNSLDSLRISYKRGIKAIEQRINDKAVWIDTSTDEQSFQILKSGRCDAVITSRFMGREVMSSGDWGSLVMHETALFSVVAFHYLHKKNADMVEPLTSVLFEMEQEGFIRDTHSLVEENWTYSSGSQ